MALRSIIGRLRADLVARTAGFEKGLKRARKRTKAFVRDVAYLGLAFGAVKRAVQAFMGTFTGAIRQMDTFAKTARRIGMIDFAEELAGMRLAAKYAGTEFGTLTKGIQYMLRNVSDAARGVGEAKDAFEMLGLEADALKQMTPGEAFRQIAEAIRKTEDPFDKMNAAMDIFGRSGGQLIPLMNMGADALKRMDEEARRTGAALGKMDLKKAELAQDAMTSATEEMNAAWNLFILDIAPQIVTTLQIVQSGITGTAGAIKRLKGILGEIKGNWKDAYLTTEDIAAWAGAEDVDESLRPLAGTRLMLERRRSLGLAMSRAQARGEAARTGAPFEPGRYPTLMPPPEMKEEAFQAKISLEQQQLQDVRSIYDGHEHALTNIKKKGEDERAKMDKFYRIQAAQSLVGSLRQMAALMDDGSRESFEATKALAYADAVVNTAASITAIQEKWAANPVVAGTLITAAAALGALQIATIAQTRYKGGGAAPSAAGRTTATPVPAGSPVAHNVYVTLEGEGYSGQQVAGLLGVIREELRDGGTLEIRS